MSVLGPHKIVHLLHSIRDCSQMVAGPKCQLRTQSHNRHRVMRCKTLKAEELSNCAQGFITADGEEKMQLRPRRGGAGKVLTKPFGGELLLEAFKWGWRLRADPN